MKLKNNVFGFSGGGVNIVPLISHGKQQRAADKRSNARGGGGHIQSWHISHNQAARQLSLEFDPHVRENKNFPSAFRGST